MTLSDKEKRDIADEIVYAQLEDIAYSEVYEHEELTDQPQEVWDEVYDLVLRKAFRLIAYGETEVVN